MDVKRKPILLAIDPGNMQSGFVEYIDGYIFKSGIEPNEKILDCIQYNSIDAIAIEMIASYGMPVGADVFETVVWIGRFVQHAIHCGYAAPRLIYRRDVKMHLCGNMHAKDKNIRQRLIDLFGPPGTKKNPGRTYGITSHAWAALALAVTASETSA
jgi:hypothetical protein